MSDTTRYCEQCGARMEEGQRFCEGCGAPVADGVLEPPREAGTAPPPAEARRTAREYTANAPTTERVARLASGSNLRTMALGAVGVMIVVAAVLFATGRIGPSRSGGPPANTGGGVALATSVVRATPAGASATATVPRAATVRPLQPTATPARPAGPTLADLAGDWMIIRSSEDTNIGTQYSFGLNSDGRLQRTSTGGVIPEVWEEMDGIETVDVFLDLKPQAAGKFAGKLVSVGADGQQLLQFDIAASLSVDRSELTIVETWPSETITSVAVRPEMAQAAAAPREDIPQGGILGRAMTTLETALAAWQAGDEDKFKAQFIEAQKNDLADEMLAVDEEALEYSARVAGDPVQSIGEDVVIRAEFTFQMKDGTLMVAMVDFTLVPDGYDMLIADARKLIE